MRVRLRARARVRGAVHLVAHQAHCVGDVAAVGELLADREAERLLELVDLRAEGGLVRVSVRVMKRVRVRVRVCPNPGPNPNPSPHPNTNPNSNPNQALLLSVRRASNIVTVVPPGVGLPTVVTLTLPLYP